jgi:hypothetical protein
VDRYEVIACFTPGPAGNEFAKELQLVYADKITVLKKQASLNIKPDLEELIKAEYDLDEENLKLMLRSRNRATPALDWTFGTGSGREWLLDTTHFITPAQIELIIANYPRL